MVPHAARDLPSAAGEVLCRRGTGTVLVAIAVTLPKTFLVDRNPPLVSVCASPLVHQTGGETFRYVLVEPEDHLHRDIGEVVEFACLFKWHDVAGTWRPRRVGRDCRSGAEMHRPVVRMVVAGDRIPYLELRPERVGANGHHTACPYGRTESVHRTLNGAGCGVVRDYGSCRCLNTGV